MKINCLYLFLLVTLGGCGGSEGNSNIVPDIPLVPIEPGKPVVPDIPLVPIEPGKPVVPDIPLVPIEPGKPVVPDIPLVPIEPGQPVVPGIPGGPNEPVPPPTGLTITAIDGYLQNALFCIDNDDDGRCSEHDVLHKLTDSKGQVNLTAAELAVTGEGNFIIETLARTATNNSYTVDKDFPYAAMNKTMSLRAPTGWAVISPISDLVVAKMRTGLSQQQAQVIINQQLRDVGILDKNSHFRLDQDYIQYAND
ncbi:MAG: hypothetical protein ACRCT7_11810, partial [Shewanella sp.]